MKCFRCLKTVQLSAETLHAGHVFVAMQSGYVQALLDNGLIVAVTIDQSGSVTEHSTEPASHALPHGVVAVPCT